MKPESNTHRLTQSKALIALFFYDIRNNPMMVTAFISGTALLRSTASAAGCFKFFVSLFTLRAV